ncbi:MAG: hypothetical protein BECKG1743F_GA0114225_102552 [Candidatus Kentron sp. G]|nr:MAG: hypothetical protein BECKG1743F_GA0114225_102552 [Candidatus Kentron sp. G]VFM99600.1 MAG: hypothetical protein BECKG1743E_GA0114224_102674 [Candidatus Kentron sp. G]
MRFVFLNGKLHTRESNADSGGNGDCLQEAVGLRGGIGLGYGTMGGFSFTEL